MITKRKKKNTNKQKEKKTKKIIDNKKLKTTYRR